MEGVRIKTTGFGFLAIIPLAFVELDMEQMKEMPKLARMRIASAGAFANVCVFFIIMFILGLFVTPFLVSLMSAQGIEITSVVSGKPAELAGLEEGVIITSVNGNETLELAAFVNEMSTVKPGETVEFGTNNGTFAITMTEDPQTKGRAYMGVFLEQVSEPTPEAEAKFGLMMPVMLWFYGLFLWIAQLNLMIGVLNFLPIWLLDGGMIFHDLISYVVKKEKIKNVVVLMLYTFTLGVLLFNIIGPFIKNLIL